MSVVGKASGEVTSPHSLLSEYDTLLIPILSKFIASAPSTVTEGFPTYSTVSCNNAKFPFLL